MLLARNDWSDLASVIAVLLFGGVSALVNLLKKRAQSQSAEQSAEKTSPREENLAKDDRLIMPEPVNRTTLQPAAPAMPAPRPAQHPFSIPPVAKGPIPLERLLKREVARRVAVVAEQKKAVEVRHEPVRRTSSLSRTDAVAATPMADALRIDVRGMDGTQWRRAFVMSEILAPPLALREES